MKLGIVGLGVVGGNLYKWFQPNKYEVLGYDKNQDISLSSWNELITSDIIFLCIPTPYIENKGIDLSAVNEVSEMLGKIKEHKLIVLKSTVPPGTTRSLSQKYPNHSWVFSPEFLREVSAYEDTASPDLVVIGTVNENKEETDLLISILPKKEILLCKAEEAELIKYGRNVFLTQKVVFGNILYDIAKKLNINYEKVRRGVTHDPRIGESHMFVNHNGGRGAGGTCFPKDLGTFVDFVSNQKLESFLILREIQKYNNNLLESTKKTKGNQYKHKK